MHFFEDNYLCHENPSVLLTNISIKNYALINEINISFPKGFSTITGETGAGKSILLDGLSLALGKRADLSSLGNNTQKCVIEADFDISSYHLEDFFATNDLNYEEVTILRREILPSGKSRAFVNDSPVNLDVLKRLGESLVDVHSQHQTLQLMEHDFQLKVVDAMAHNQENLKAYRTHLSRYRQALEDLQRLREFQSDSHKEHDYNKFLLKELGEVSLRIGTQEELETEHEQLNNVEQMMELLSQGNRLLNTEQTGILGNLAELKRTFQNLSRYGTAYKELNARIQSVCIEVDDITSELERHKDIIQSDPERLETINAQLRQLHDLQKKHQVRSVEELLGIKNKLTEKVGNMENMASKIQAKETEVVQLNETLEQLATKIRDARNAVVPQLKSRLEESLKNLGMPSATFKIEVGPSNTFKANGKDDLVFRFSSNKGSGHSELKKVASGGELSRIMLTIKSILAKYEQLPTLMFDEIDTGVSGEVSNRMGEIMQQMGRSMQVLSITHLPQVASKGKQQYIVYKENKNGMARAQMKLLTKEERVRELAKMLGGNTPSNSALAHARELLEQV